MGSPWLCLLLLPPPLGRRGEQSLKASQCPKSGQMPGSAHVVGGVTASSSGTVTSTTSPGTSVLCAITEATATNFACKLVGGPKTKVTGVVICKRTTPRELTVITET